MFEELRAKYLASFAQKITQLEQALEAKDPQALGYLVHQLAGSSGSYGFDKISQSCSEIEAAIHHNPEAFDQISIQTKNLITMMHDVSDAN